MTDSCFKLFRSKCCRSAVSVRDSCESIFESGKCGKHSLEKKPSLDIAATPIDNGKRVKADSDFVEALQFPSAEVEAAVILRRPNRLYLRSISTVTSLSSDDDGDDENLDVLYPLPTPSPHERPALEFGLDGMKSVLLPTFPGMKPDKFHPLSLHNLLKYTDVFCR